MSFLIKHIFYTRKVMEFINLSKESMPEPNTLVWCKRKDGRAILATRGNHPLSINVDDPSKDCYWYGFPETWGLFITINHVIDYSINFSDTTVEGFYIFEKPSFK